MKYLKSYKIFESVNSDQFFKTKEDIKDWLDRMGIKDYIIHDDLIVDVDGNVNISDINLKLIPVQFGKVNGNFSCSDNQLKSLEGCPKYVGENFYCGDNQLTSLEGCPKSVGGDFDCNNNQLKDFKGCPEYIEGYFSCSSNQLKDFKGLNKFKYIYCSDNPIHEIYQLFNDPKCIQWINEYNVIQGDKIDLDNFKEVLYMLDIQDFDFNQLKQLKNYKI